MHLLPALAVLDAERGVVVQQRLADLGFGFARHRQVDRRQALRVPVVGGGAQLQEGAVKENNSKFK